jgi:hypothetical protein
VRKVSAKPIDPSADTFVVNINAAFVEKVFDIAKRQRKSDMHQYGELDDLRRGFELTKGVLGHFPRLIARITYLKPGSAHNIPEANRPARPSQGRLH